MKVAGSTSAIKSLVARDGVSWTVQGLIGGKQPFVELRVNDGVPFKGAFLQRDGTVTCGFPNPAQDPHKFKTVHDFLEAVR